ncbi:hypothetical protein Esti_001510 [Eimeria stiedai]
MHFGVGGDDTLLEARWKIQAGASRRLQQVIGAAGRRSFMQFAMHGNNSRSASIEAAVAPRRPRKRRETTAAPADVLATRRTMSPSKAHQWATENEFQVSATRRYWRRGRSRPAASVPTASRDLAMHSPSDMLSSCKSRSFSVTVGRLLRDLEQLADPLNVLQHHKQTRETGENHARTLPHGNDHEGPSLANEVPNGRALQHKTELQLQLLMQLVPSKEQ